MTRLFSAALTAAYPALLRILPAILGALVFHVVGLPEVLTRILVAFVAITAWMHWGLLTGLPNIPLLPGETNEQYIGRMTPQQKELVVALGIARSAFTVMGLVAVAWLVF